MASRLIFPGVLSSLIVVGTAMAGGHAATSASAPAAASTPAIGDILDLTTAINRALAQNRSLVLTSLGTRSSELGVAAARTAFRLSVRPEISANLSDRDEASIYGLRIGRRLTAGTDLSATVLNEPDFSNGGRRERLLVEVSQPLFRNAGSLITLEPTVQANQALRSAQRRFEIQKADLVVEVVRSYENILRLKQQVRADVAAVKRATTLLRVTRAKEQLGRVTRIDTLRVELQHGQARASLENDQQRLASARRDLAELMGMSPDAPFSLRPTTVFVITEPSPEEGVEIALVNRLDYAQVLQDLDDAMRGTLIARRGLLPDVRLVGRYERANAPLGVFDSGDRDRWLLGLASNSDLNRAVERVALSRALVDQAAAQQLIGVVELSIAREVQQRLLDYRRSHAELEILRRNFDHAGARLTLARRLFEAGRGDNFSVTDAEQAFLDAESQLLTGRSDTSISGYELLRSLGTLTETPKSLKPERL